MEQVSNSGRRQPLPDIVLDSQLKTEITDGKTIHSFLKSDPARRKRPRRVEESWVRRTKLGSGSFGEVWLEICVGGPQQGSRRAVKEIKKSQSAENHARELEAIAKFSQQPVCSGGAQVASGVPLSLDANTNAFKYRDWFVRSHGWFETDSTVFIAMEYLEHGDLQQFLDAPFPEPEARSVTCQALEALQYMHTNGFTHRDLKPGNILVLHSRPDWWVKLADFGMSKRVDQDTALRSFVGTIQYLAPELHRFDEKQKGPSYTSAVDVWALGLIAYRMMTGQAAFPGNLELFTYTMGGPFPSDLLVQSSASAECCDFIEKSLAPSAAARLTADSGLMHAWIKMADEDATVDNPSR